MVTKELIGFQLYMLNVDIPTQYIYFFYVILVNEAFNQLENFQLKYMKYNKCVGIYCISRCIESLITLLSFAAIGINHLL